MIGKIGVNDKEAKVKDKSNEVLEQTEKELINFVTSQQTQSPYVTISSTLSCEWDDLAKSMFFARVPPQSHHIVQALLGWSLSMR